MIDTISIIELFIVLILVSFSAFFSSAETAFISVNRIKMMHLAEQGDRRAKIIHQELEYPERFITAILVGNNIVNVTASVLVTAVTLKYFGSAGIAIATGMMTIIVLVFGEIVPKTFAAKQADSHALKIAKLLLLFTRIVHPLVFVFTYVTNIIFRIVGVGDRVKNPFITEDQIKLLMKVGVDEGIFERHEKEYIQNIFEFTDEYAAEIMTPLQQLVCIEDTRTLNESLEKMNDSGHSRLPVWKNNSNNVIGMVYAKDLLRYRDAELAVKTVAEIIRPIMIVRTTRKIASLFKELQKKKMQIAVVVDEKNQIAGILSIEDILEEIVGEILDEYDVEEMNQEIGG